MELVVLPTDQTMVLAPLLSVWLMAGDPAPLGPPHQAVETVGGLAALIFNATSPPLPPAGQFDPEPRKTT